MEAELDAVEAKTSAEAASKRQRVLDKFIGDPEKPTTGLYADPAKM